MKSIYTTYKERLVEVSGKNRSIYSKKGNTKFSFDIGELLANDKDSVETLVDVLWGNNNNNFPLINKDVVKKWFPTSKYEASIQKDSKYRLMLESNPTEAKKLLSRLRNDGIKKVVEDYVKTFGKLKKEIVDLAKETGRYELYIGYPFVHGNLDDYIIKAPLILFPIRIDIIDDSHVEIELVKDMPITLNKALMFAISKEKKINVDDMDMEFDGEFHRYFKDITDVLEYLKTFHIEFDEIEKKAISSYESSGDPSERKSLKLFNHCIIGRYNLANSIYTDYTELEKRRATTNSVIDELIFAKRGGNGQKKSISSLYSINKLDYTQEKAIERINTNGNMVIYGPPGTGKSQTIVNIISDALSRKKRVLVVSQKKAALDVVYNRLGKIKERSMFVVDPEKEKEFFYKKCLDAHTAIEIYDCSQDLLNHEKLQDKINNYYLELEKIFNVLYEPGKFGASLETMYEQSSQISKNSYDYKIYEELINRKDLLEINYKELDKALANICENDRKNLYFKYKKLQENNSIVDHLKSDLDLYTVESAVNRLERLLSNSSIGFDISKYPYCAYLVAHAIFNQKDDVDTLRPLIKLIVKQNNKNGLLSNSARIEKDLESIFKEALKEIREKVEEFKFLKEVLTDNGYQMMISAILNGNSSLFRNLKQALNSYTKIKDIKFELTHLEDLDKTILDFAYELSDGPNKYKQILDNFMAIRMYIEIVEEEKNKKEDLAKIMNFNSIKKEILDLKKRQNELANRIASSRFNDDYINRFKKSKNSKDFLYQISKQQNPWTIRKFMNKYGNLMLDLYPCWLLSPENVSTIMPLVKDMFDIVLVDEASQVFIENTLPIIYRGKNIVVAGDSKQLKPTSTFMKRYMGSDVDDDIDPTTEAALEVESLLDLATTRLSSTNLNYHYRSKNEELIDFSNNYFYDSKLEIAPNLVSSKKNQAIKRFKVEGKWVDRKNEAEAKQVVDLLKKILKTRKNKESIGIITFNSEQAYEISNAISKECKANPRFNEDIVCEQNRFENNEDVSLFIKNLENVQGDERDIIILSVGYALNDNGRITTNFGSLSSNGGENRLNVAITRAKESIYVVTSIEPEDLKVDKAKNEGPKILKRYLNYIRAVASNNKKEVKVWLNNKKENIDEDITSKDIIAMEMKSALEKLNYCVDVKVGNTKSKVDLAVYDNDLNQYLLGIECINKDYKNIDEMIQNQLYHFGFLESRGWKMYQVWTRDWWFSRSKVINSIVKEIEKSRKEAMKKPGDSKK